MGQEPTRRCVAVSNTHKLSKSLNPFSSHPTVTQECGLMDCREIYFRETDRLNSIAREQRERRETMPTQEATEGRKPKALDMSTNYLKLGKKVFAVKEIQGEGIDIEQEIREFYKTKYGQHAEALNGAVAEEMTEQWNAGIHRIQEYGRNAGREVIIPSQLIGKPVFTFGSGYLMELRLATYTPIEISGTYYQMAEQIGADHRLIRPFRRNHADLTVFIKPQVSFPIYVGFDEKHRKLFIPKHRTIHTFSDGSVCTGNATPEQFWSMDDETLSREISKVNLFSPATSVIKNGDQRWAINDLITPETVENVIRKGGDTQWSIGGQTQASD